MQELRDLDPITANPLPTSKGLLTENIIAEERCRLPVLINLTAYFIYLKLMHYKEMDQTHWVCYELPNKSYYYGEVALLDESGVVQPKDSPDAANPKNKVVKHGFGIYLYNCNAEGQHSRY